MRLLYIVTIGVVLLSLFINKSNAACSETNPCVQELGQGQPFQEPDQINIETFKRITLDVDIGEVQFGWLKLKRRMYNGKLTGPTWNVNKGAHVYLTLNNKLSDKNNDQNKPENVMKKPNTTNMHTHGLHISSMSPQDNVGINIEPGDSYYYKYCLHEQQPSGTCWYHAHVHGSTLFQVHSGLAGILIVNDDAETLNGELRHASCPEHCENDIQMIFQGSLQFTSPIIGFATIQDSVGDDEYFKQDQKLKDWLKTNVNFMTVNGLLQPVLTLKEGMMYRFRMVNAAGYDTIEPIFTEKGTNNTSDACTIREIALDGIYLDRPRQLNGGQSFLAPGYRVDWMISCKREGEFELRSYPNPKNKMSTGKIERWSGLLLTIKVIYDGGNWNDKRDYNQPIRRNQMIRQLEESDNNKYSDEKEFIRQYGGWQDGYHGSPQGRYHGSPQGGYHGSPHGRYPGSPQGGYHGSPHGRYPGSPQGGNQGWPDQGQPATKDEWWANQNLDQYFDITLPTRPSFVNDLRNLQEENIKERFVMEFDTGLMLNREQWSTGDNIRYAMTVDTVQEWHVVNADSEESHPFHPHINSFQIISYNAYTGPFSPGFMVDPVFYSQVDRKPCAFQRLNSKTVEDNPIPESTFQYLGHDQRYQQDGDNTLAYARVGDWKDTLLIPPLSNITVRFIPDRYTGALIIHCHLLVHEDEGMMMIAKIVEPGQSRLANISSGNAYPGTCDKCDRYPFNNPKRLCDLDQDAMNELNNNNIRTSATTVAKKSQFKWKRKFTKKEEIKGAATAYKAKHSTWSAKKKKNWS